MTNPDTDTIHRPKLEAPERVEVELVGGPAHGDRVWVRRDRRKVEVTYAAEDDGPEIPADGSRPKATQPAAVLLVYVRASEDALTAEFEDMELFG